MKDKNKILVLGASGMLGNAVLRIFSQSNEFIVTGTVRSNKSINYFPKNLHNLIISGIDIENTDNLHSLFDEVKPNIVINCIGLVKQLSDANNPLTAIPINSLFPHKLASMCASSDARLIHMSTDCVFTGNKGMYTEDDIPDAQDLYGISKRLGEVSYSNTLTLRTSIIGHELNGNRSLIDWFLSQEGSVKGFDKAIFSGLPTTVIGTLIRDYIIPNSTLTGIYHVSAKPISKYDLLLLVADIYGKDIEIIKDNELKIDRSLDSSRFRKATGFNPPTWPELIKLMHDCK